MKFITKIIHRLLGIDQVLSRLDSMDEKMESVAKTAVEFRSCIRSSGRGYGHNKSISMTHWNDP